MEMNDLIKEGKNLYFLFGEEKYLKNEMKTSIINHYLGDAEKDMNLEIINKDTYLSDEIGDKINSVPFFSDARVVILDEIDFRSKGELYDILLSMPDTTIVVVIEEKKNKTKDGDDKEDNTSSSFDYTKFKKEANVKDKIVEVDTDKDKDQVTINRVKEICEEYSIKINNVNVSYLLNKTGNDMFNITNETKKLCMYVLDKKEITKDDIDLLINDQLEEKIFDLIDALTRKNMTEVQKIYRALLTSGNDERQMLPLIAWQYMLIYEVKLALDEKKSVQEIIKVTGQKEYPIKKAMTVANQKGMTKEKLQKIIGMCNDQAIGFSQGIENLDIVIDKIMAM
ncbi:MAG: DNA polymerase III subunit delta [Clostridia bacterium]|nr:DNA polymerase III subunit delta [Clostridia bacterium]